jgi:hypothetical protein
MDTAARPNPDRTVKLADAGELIAAIPSLMGFHPADSVLLITLRAGMVGLTARADLAPPPLHAALVGRLVGPVRQAKPDAVVLLVVCAEPDPTHEDLVRRAIDAIGVPALHTVWTPSITAGAPWRCYLHEGCRGELPDPAVTECAAATTLAGFVTFDSRDDLVRLLDPPDPARMIRLSSLLDVTCRSDRTSSAQHLATVRAAITAGTPPATDEEFVRLALAVSDYRVRDACLGYALDAAVAPAAERLWLELARCLPPPERAEAAVLLAVSAYLRGDGALANVALDHARTALPGHNLASLLHGAIGYGIPPAQVRQVLADAAADAHIEIAEEPDMTT